MSEIVNKMGDLVSAFGTAANDAQSFFDTLATQGSQPVNFDASAAQASQLLSMANAVAASASLVLGKLPVPAGYIGSAGLAISIESLGVNSAQLTRAIGSGNYNDIITSVAAVAASVGGTAVSVDSILGAAGWATRMFPWAIPLTVVATAVQMVWQNRESFVWAGNELLDAFHDATQQATFTGDLARSVNDLFTAAQNYVIPRRDPLVLDLDGDGLELIGANGTVLFDHNADGIKTGTGWVSPDDGLLVRDLNGNGLIDSGRELFGIDTLKANNTLAANGFDALKDLDSNADGLITSADTAFADLKVWQDLNQDGISQAGELQTLSTLGISSIGVNGTATGPQAGQLIAGNRVDLSTTFTQNGAARTVGAIDFQVNNFYTQFPAQVVDEAGNPVAITAQAKALPQMNGSGMVRNMQAAASYC